ncbi:transcriptional regulator NadR [Dulcicalothrix desertica PCC 7102]|uniref:Transcriptional regulator NadR n=1 Tax=Dulcicalothrix desertica PCC 7102 TaxID=232991 RepID=A0A3S1B5C1_9CYAN|nr:AAA family ATPase [Dulcicalothrix desertica]RUT05145.1 transcriptional regulator NadR [Dulcicalothrix desertica PCC 7102]TWH43347.1 NadR type nicotinamide-nucleotide adenylyltransferase [Dulcicalothrix desertica PCC 7102]
MNSRYGLTLGKYAPLHKGHQFVIETAILEMNKVVVMIYDSPEVTNIPLAVRVNWLRSIYPSVEVIEAWDGPSETGLTPEIKKMHEDYIIKQLAGRKITHFYSSEFYGEHVSEALGAINRLVDCERNTVPISATQIRENAYACRSYLHPLVYRDLIKNVVFLGAPSTGKTTIASQLAQEYNTEWMPEYGREYWEEHQVNKRLSLMQLVEIAQGHLEREEALLRRANQYLFTDTNALTTYHFSLYYHNAAAPELVQLAIESASRYDLVFVCSDDIPYDDTYDRSEEVNRKIFQRQIENELIIRKIPFFRLCGNIDERVKYVKNVLGQYIKYSNIVDCI